MLALLCGGQGLITPAVFDLVAEAPEAQPIFAAAATLLGADPRALLRDAITNRTSQILSVTAALAVHAAIESCLPAELLVAGYSVGAMAAWSIAGIHTAAETLRLTAARAQAMDEASPLPGRLCYLRGSRDTVERLAQQHDCTIAITNPGGVFVIGGTATAIAAFCAETGAQTLAVHVAAHTKLLADAVPIFESALRAVPPHALSSGRVLLTGATRVFNPSSALPALAAQIATPIDWTATLDAIAERGVTRILDLGPGAALQRGAQTHLPHVACYAAAAFHGIDGLRDWLLTA